MGGRCRDTSGNVVGFPILLLVASSNIMTSKNTAKTKKPGLYANIKAKKERIEKGSGETMRKKGTEGAPEADAFRKAEKTAKKKLPHLPTN